MNLSIRTVAIFLTIFGSALIVLAGAFLSDQKNVVTIVKPRGFVNEGTIFGIAIGEPESRALITLAHQNLEMEMVGHAGGDCLFRTYGADYVVNAFLDKSWRQGGICVITYRGQVVEVVWSFLQYPVP